MSSSNFETLLDECLARLYAGERVDDILRAHPEHAVRLRPLLEVAMQMSHFPAPHARPSAFREGRQRMLDAIDQKITAPSPPIWRRYIDNLRSFFLSLRPVVGNAFALILLIGLVVSLTWILASLDFKSDPAGQQTSTQTPTSTITPTENPPTLTETASPTPTGTPSPTVSPTITPTGSSTSSITPSPNFVTLTPTPSPTKKKGEDEPTEIPTPSDTPTPPYPPPVTETPIPPYPAPATETPIPTHTAESPTSTVTEENEPLTPTGSVMPTETGTPSPTPTP